MVANDLNCLFVGAYSSVGSETEELAANGSFRYGVDVWTFRQGGVAYIINDTDGEAISWIILLEVIEDRKDLSWCCIFGTKAVASTDDERLVWLVEVGFNHVKIERFADGTWFFCAIENCNLLYSLRNYAEEMFS